MKYLLIIFLALSSTAFSQTEADYKDYLVDSLRKAGVDTLFVLGEYRNQGICIVPFGIGEICNVNVTYTLIWVKNNRSYFKLFDNCYETDVIESRNQNWFDFFQIHREEITGIRVLDPNSFAVIARDTIYFTNCANSDSLKDFVYDEYGFLRFELLLSQEFYKKELIPYCFLYDIQPAEPKELQLLRDLIVLIEERNKDYSYMFGYIHKRVQLKMLD